MKQKLFSIFCCLLLSASMVTQAYDFEWAWSEINTNGTSKSKNNWNGYPVYRCQFESNLLLFYTVKTSGTLPTYTINGTAYVMPTIGNNTIQNSGSDHTIVNVNYLLNGGDICSFMVLTGSSGQTTFYMKSGTLTVEEGADGPFIHSKGSTKTYFTTNGTNSTSCTFSIGSAATYRTVSVQSEDDAKGTTSYAVKSGYVYEVDGTYCKHWKNNSVYTLTASPKSGYRFVCWKKGSTQISTNAVTDVTITGNATYTAYFEPDQYSITYKDQGDVTFTGSHESGYPTTHTYGTATTLKSASKANYTFDGWFTNSACTGAAVTSLGATAYTSKITLYAKWTYVPPVGNTVTLTLDKTGNGTVTVRDADLDNALVTFTNGEAEVGENHNVSITATPAAGYHLTSVTLGGESINNLNQTFEIFESTTLSVVFEPDVYTITYRDKGNGNFTGTHGANHPTTHTYGTATALVNPTKSGAVFGGWYTSSDCSGDAITSLAATAYTSAPTVYAKWIYNGTITANASPAAGGSVTVNQPSTTGGSSVTLNASANGGYAFTGWDDNNDGVVDNTDAVRTVYVDGDKEYVAKFVQCVSIYTEEGTLQHNSANFTITGTDGDYTVQLNFDDALSAGLHTYNNMDNTITYSYVIDHGTKLQIKKVSVPVYYHGTNWLAANIEDVIIETTNGNVYKVTIYTNRITNGDKTYCDGGSCTWVGYNSNVVKELDLTYGPTLQSDGSYLVRFYTYIPNSSTYYEEYQGALSIYSDDSSLPTGRYPINSTQKSGTVFVGGCDDDESFYDSWIDVWYREMTGATQTYSSTWTMRYGYVDIVNYGNGTYYFDVHAYSANGYPIRFTMGTPPVSYKLAWDANGGELSGTYTAAGSVNEGTSITAPTATKNGYTFVKWRDVTNGVDFTGTMPSSNVTYTAQWNIVNYDLTYEGLEGATNSSNPTSYNIESETITLADPGTRDGYIFAGWKDESDNAITEIAHGSTGNRTLTATWTKATTLDLYDNKDATYYNNIKDLDEKTYDVTLYRTFKPGRWSTICLPFDYYQAQMEGHPLKGNINEYLYSEGNATSGGSGLTLYFKSAKSIEAGKPYLVYNTTGDDIVNLTFAGVTIDTDLDTKDADIDYILSKFSYKQSGSISLVGTFRKIKLPEQNHAYMGLMYDETAGKTKIYYPGTNANVPAYRAFFHIDDATPAQQRVRIVVDGVDMGEMLIDNGEIVPTTENLSADRAPRKYIRNGVLVIERNGVTYDAQGKKL